MNYSERTAALASTLEADGYHLAIEELDSRLAVTITAGPDARLGKTSFAEWLAHNHK